MVKQVAAEMGSASLREKTLSLGVALKYVQFSQISHSKANSLLAS